MTNRKGVPALKALQAFDVAVRLGSMTAAARELGTTQPAISQQIRSLEDLVGGALFNRVGGRLVLTDVGAEFHAEITLALSTIDLALERAQARSSCHRPNLSISANFGFAHLWLLPRLQRLIDAFPNIQFDVLSDDRLESCSLQEIDIVITFDKVGGGPQTEVLLSPETVFPVCSPEFAKVHALHGVLAREKLDGVPLLHMDQRNPRWLDWGRWSLKAGIGVFEFGKGFTFNNFPLLLNAAVDGKGLTLAWKELVGPQLASGKLIALEPVVVRSDHGYLLRTRHRNNSLVEPVVKWFQEQVVNG